jgi:hypothetical protein
VLSVAANGYGEVAHEGQPNLYRIERVEFSPGAVNWVASFIATLSSQDGDDWGGNAGFRGALASLTAGVSNNGEWLAFMSDRPLTGYDNLDRISGKRDEEVFLYDASGRRLVCASCDPSGARPHGLRSPGFIDLFDSQSVWGGSWVAGLIPAWERKSLQVGVYRPRYLSNSGRLFFDSADALVPQDVNGTMDVYEYEPSDVGSCTTGSETYSTAQGGCIGLISSGISSQESVFLDASETGGDVFFLTAAKLVRQDTDDAYDVYDAHVCGSGGAGEAGWACSPPAAVSPPCSNTSSCRGAPEQQPAMFGAPPSATFSGAGNIAPGLAPAVSKQTTTRAAKCRKGLAKKKGKCVKQKLESKRKAKKSTARKGSK